MMRKTLLLTVLLGIILMSCQKNELGQAADTVEKLNTDFYTMKVCSDVGFNRFLAQGGAKNADEISAYLSDYLSPGPFGKLDCSIEVGGIACSALHVQNAQGEQLVGRNFDWDNCRAMVIRSFPENAYASISTANLNFLGFGDNYEPTGLADSYKAVVGVYVPMDGINEKGVMVADLVAGDDERTDQNTEGRVHLTTTTAMRLVLDKAANVDEALELLRNANIHSDIDLAHHLIIADASGRSVDVEWVNNEMVVVETDVLNNHYLCEQKYHVGQYEASFTHESRLLAARDTTGGIMGREQLADAMFSVLSLPEGDYYGGTQWTTIYNLSDCSVTYYWRRDRARTYTFYAGSDFTLYNK